MTSDLSDGGPRAFASSTSGGITVNATGWNYEGGAFSASRLGTGGSDWVLYTFSEGIDTSTIPMDLDGGYHSTAYMTANLSAEKLRQLTSAMSGQNYSFLQDQFGFQLPGDSGMSAMSLSATSTSFANAVLFRMSGGPGDFDLDPIVGGNITVPEPALLVLLAGAAGFLRRRHSVTAA